MGTYRQSGRTKNTRNNWHPSPITTATSSATITKKKPAIFARNREGSIWNILALAEYTHC